ncbi:hypothetical protein R1sor_022340 [Riccia sorocarpa]|uniref:Reverse transcriptase domain-containing protein n=1 Tax=Riccia sorocarpa TaxID=122646 RepID=A0ABD3GQF4_9MARC
MEFGPQFINCIKALTSTATSTVIVSKTRSGKDTGHFADDTHLMLEAQPTNLSNAKEAIDLFAKASGLKVQWNKSLATLISPSPRPVWTENLQWKWTENQEQHRVLGFIFTDAIDQAAIFQKCVDRIDKAMNEKKLSSQSLQGRITIANHIIYGFIWFILPLWAGDTEQLKFIDKKVVKFVWGGANQTPRHRIAQKVLHLPKAKGGLGLLAAQQQASAFAATTITWAMTPGKFHSLKQLIRAELEQRADNRWGASIQSALLYTRNCKTEGSSPTMYFLLSAWAKTAALISSPGSTDKTTWGNTLIWGPPIQEVRTKTLSCKTQGHRSIREKGYTLLKHIADEHGRIKELADVDSNLMQDRKAKAAYEKIKDITIDFQNPSRSVKSKTFYAGTGDADG